MRSTRPVIAVNASRRTSLLRGMTLPSIGSSNASRNRERQAWRRNRLAKATRPAAAAMSSMRQTAQVLPRDPAQRLPHRAQTHSAMTIAVMRRWENPSAFRMPNSGRRSRSACGRCAGRKDEDQSHSHRGHGHCNRLELLAESCGCSERSSPQAFGDAESQAIQSEDQRGANDTEHGVQRPTPQVCPHEFNVTHATAPSSTRRSANAAACGSCVTMTMVWPPD